MNPDSVVLKEPIPTEEHSQESWDSQGVIPCDVPCSSRALMCTLAAGLCVAHKSSLGQLCQQSFSVSDWLWEGLCQRSGCKMGQSFVCQVKC